SPRSRHHDRITRVAARNVGTPHDQWPTQERLASARLDAARAHVPWYGEPGVERAVPRIRRIGPLLSRRRRSDRRSSLSTRHVLAGGTADAETGRALGHETESGRIARELPGGQGLRARRRGV